MRSLLLQAIESAGGAVNELRFCSHGLSKAILQAVEGKNLQQPLARGTLSATANRNLHIV